MVKSALKVVSIPKEEWEIDEDYRNGFTEQEITSKYRELLEQYKNEYVFMMKMKGQSNIVSCEDIYVEKQNNGIGYNVYIRMELLKPLNQYLQNQVLSEEEVIRIGKDICWALILCHRQNIIHRDIKPSNILRSFHGNYKLGDFGISKVMEQTTTATGIGTKGYAAPEVFRMKRYGKTADIYSLGVVLYWLLNERRMPFMESAFSSEEAGIIQTTTVTADETPNFETDPGNDTVDQVFLFSINEAEQYFENDEARRCAATKYALAQGIWINENYTIDDEAVCWWWLRSPGDADIYAASVPGVGAVYYGGDYVNDDNYCVRPALWINSVAFRSTVFGVQFNRYLYL